ncbi:MAG: Crp/Fnr family transcriptional regulator [Alphaproteobacteria bacterium]|nr:Crp/Fnr family transcriptional regulator [Alphaproteobacteria bacterium]
MAPVANEQNPLRSRHAPDALRDALLFSSLSDEELACFHNAAQFRSYKKGKILYLQDEPADFFYVIRNGWVKLFHTMPEGEEIIIDMLSYGSTVGESAVFEHGAHTSSAQVVEDVQLFSIPSALLKEQIKINPALALGMLSSLSQHYRKHYSEMALNAMQTAPQRIGCFLLRLCPESEGSAIVFLPYDKNLIAYVLGMRGATFSRALNMLRQKAGIRIDGTRVEIDSVEQLTKFTYGPFCEVPGAWGHSCMDKPQPVQAYAHQ